MGRGGPGDVGTADKRCSQLGTGSGGVLGARVMVVTEDMDSQEGH
jgi:hypothetical protein